MDFWYKNESFLSLRTSTWLLGSSSHYILQWRGAAARWRSNFSCQQLLYHSWCLYCMYMEISVKLIIIHLHTAILYLINGDKQATKKRKCFSVHQTHCRSWVWICVCSRSRETVCERRRLWLWRSTPPAGQRSPETRHIRSVWWSCTDSHASIAPAHCRSPPHPRICRKTTRRNSSCHITENTSSLRSLFLHPFLFWLELF